MSEPTRHQREANPYPSSPDTSLEPFRSAGLWDWLTFKLLGAAVVLWELSQMGRIEVMGFGGLIFGGPQFFAFFAGKWLSR